MKKLGTLFILTFILLTTYSCEPQKTPIDYYNSAVGRSNLSYTFFLKMNQAVRDRELGEYTDYDLENSLKFPSEYTKVEIEKLEGLLGNESSDKLIQTAIDLGKYEYDLATGGELKAIFKLIDDSPNIGTLQENLAPHAQYLDSIFAKHDMLSESLDSEITKYAEANNIEQN